MSLINSMLSDLEKRRGGSLRNVDRALDGLRPAVHAEPDAAARWRIAAIAAMATVILSAVFMSYRFVARSAATGDPTPATPRVASQPITVAAPPQPAVSVLLADQPAPALPTGAPTAAIPATGVTPEPGAPVATDPPATPVATADTPDIGSAPEAPGAVTAADTVVEPEQYQPEPQSAPIAEDEAARDTGHPTPPAAGQSGAPASMPVSFEALAIEAIERGELDDAEQLLREGLSTKPDDDALRRLLGRTLLQRGDAPGAIAELRAIATAPPAEDPELHVLLAAAEQRAGRHREASERYRALLQATPDSGQLLVGLAISLKALGDRNGAHEAFASALADPSLPPSLRGFSVRQINEFEALHP